MKTGWKVAMAVIGAIIFFGGISVGLCVLIDNGIEKKYEAYTSAIQADTAEEFANAIANKQNVIATDKLIANELVSVDEIEGEYAYISVSHRKKVMKTRIVTQKVGNTNQTRTEIYYEWMFVGSNVYHGETFNFMGYEFNYDNVDLPERHLKDVDYNGFSQDTYYVVDNNVEGTMFVFFNGDKIHTEFHDDSTIEEAIDKADSKLPLIVCAILCSIGTIVACIIIGNKVWDYCDIYGY
jgi:hypothetical protein